MRRLLNHGALLSAIVLVATGCATKNWVTQLVSKKQAEMETRQADTDRRVGQVEGRVGETTALAQQAHARADDVNSRLTRLWNNRHKRNLVDTVHVQFAFDRADLSDNAQTMLLGVVKELKANEQLSVDLEGFTDQVGTRDYNIALSQRRVEAVRRFLIQNGTELPRIQSVGLGMVDGAGKNEAAAKQRRVTVKLMIGTD